MKIDNTSVGYVCVLNKEALAYNLAYHLANMEEGDNPYRIIESILNNFEYNKKNSWLFSKNNI